MMNSSDVYRLLSWLSPSFPIGAYTYSHGLEYAVEAGLVSNETELLKWLKALLRHGTGRVDGMLFRAAYEANDADLPELIELAAAMRGTSEMSNESHSQGRAFLRTMESGWGCSLPANWLVRTNNTDYAVPYSIAVALVCRSQHIDMENTLTAYLQAFASNIVSAALRLLPIGQTSGQAILANMVAVIGEVVDEVMRSPFSDLGSSTPMLDWVSMQHENQYTRLFRS